MKYRLLEALCLILAVLFIAYSVSTQTGSKKTAVEIYDEMCTQEDFTKDIALQDNSNIKKTFGFSADDFESIIYYSSDDVMNVNELLIIKLKDGTNAQDFADIIENHNQEQYEIFSNYAPQQGEYLKNHILITNQNTIFYYVGGESEKAQDAFQNAI